MAPPVLAAVCGLDTALYHLFGSLQIPTPAHISLPPVVVYYHTPLPAPDTRLRFQLIYPLARGSFHLAFFLYYGVFSPCVIPFHTPSMFVPGRDGAILGGVSLVRHLCGTCLGGVRFVYLDPLRHWALYTYLANSDSLSYMRVHCRAPV